MVYPKSKWHRLGDYVDSSLKGITPKYVDNSNIIVLNQKCIRNNRIDYSLARFHDGNKKFSDSKIVRKGDLLFNSTGQGTAGRCAFVNELPKGKKVITDSHILILRLGDYHLAECFSYSCFQEEGLIQKFMDGSTGQGELDKLRLFNIEFRLPETDERKKICHFLNLIDAKIDLNNKINAELEAMAKLIYDYWFVQFDFPTPAEYAQAVGRPEMEGKPYKSSGGKMVYDERLKREIPEGWTRSKFGEYAKVSSGFAFKSSDWILKGCPVIKIKDITEEGNIDLSDLAFVSESIAEKAERFESKAGDVIIAMTGATIGKFAIIPFSQKPFYINQRVGLYNLGNNPLQKVPFLYCSLKQKYVREQIFLIGSGAAQPNISGEQLDNIQLIGSPPDLISKFNQENKPLFKKILLNQDENQQLAALRDWLLPMLMNGQVKVE
ncbi:restriction endonuclease subunit S [Phaeodactylibacter xiamenensis]|uniref:restriction endonuclease subunit S n=1 Tax=Phaeodactylibacter xiamenensis TaxID=1524460 RepID=UPI003CCC113B